MTPLTPRSRAKWHDDGHGRSLRHANGEHKNGVLYPSGRTVSGRAINLCRSGPTVIEYGLAAALVAVAIIGGLIAVGSNLNTLYGTVSTTVGS
jgi:pilus assembly protein Flp/PilA